MYTYMVLHTATLTLRGNVKRVTIVINFTLSGDFTTGSVTIVILVSELIILCHARWLNDIVTITY